MMRFAGLFLAFFLLTSAATVYAECTWVLWDNEWSLEPSFWERWFESDTKKWVVSAAFEKKQDCERAREEKLSAPWNQSKPAGRQIRFYCFPDTVDVSTGGKISHRH
jgi:hypothetical protein